MEDRIYEATVIIKVIAPSSKRAKIRIAQRIHGGWTKDYNIKSMRVIE